MNDCDTIARYTFTGLLLLLTSCFDKDPEIAPADYFPLPDNRTWTYQRLIGDGNDDSSDKVFDTLHLYVAGDTLVEGRSYKQIMNRNGNTDKVVRKEGTQYFGRDHELYGGYTHEYMFLDLGKKAGDSWFYIKYGGSYKTEYVIKATDATHTIHGKVYTGVIEVEVNYYYATAPDQFEYRFSATHYYANGVGEIYNFYPHQSSFHFGDLSTLLISYEK